MESTESSYVSSPEGPRKHAGSPPPKSPSQELSFISPLGLVHLYWLETWECAPLE
ncbi:RNA-binding protein Nova-2-like, partial [Trifolium pratense]